MTAPPNRYSQIIERIFLARYEEGAEEVVFERDDIALTAAELGIKLPKNLGDLVYSFRYRATLPQAVSGKAPEGKQWMIRPAGRSRYRFVATVLAVIVPNELLAVTKIPDATPGMISMYASGDEQALLAKLRYNRLIDIFTGVTCYSLQSHLQTALPSLGQVETDEIYLGLDRRGAQYVFPVQAKGGKDILGVVQIEQDMAMCAAKFPQLVCRPIAAQFMRQEVIAMFEFERGERGMALAAEKHYRLVEPEEIGPSDLETYGTRSS